MSDLIERQAVIDAMNSEWYTKNMRVHKKTYKFQPPRFPPPHAGYGARIDTLTKMACICSMGTNVLRLTTMEMLTIIKQSLSGIGHTLARQSLAKW